MATQELYYIAPSDEAFNDMKQVCIDIWSEYDDEYGYATEKINAIKDIKNVRDNFMYMFGMFDHINQKKVIVNIEPETKVELFTRLPNYYTL